MAPYFRLLDLGGGSPQQISPALRSWFVDGVRSQDLQPDRGTPKERQDLAKRKLEELADAFASHFTGLEGRHDILDYPGSFDLRHQIRAALRDLYHAVDAHQSASSASFI